MECSRAKNSRKGRCNWEGPKSSRGYFGIVAISLGVCFWGASQPPTASERSSTAAQIPAMANMTPEGGPPPISPVRTVRCAPPRDGWVGLSRMLSSDPSDN